MKVYQAGPLFSEAEQDWHRKCKAKLISAGHEVIWPYELFDANQIASWGADAPRRIMETDKGALLGCDVVVALLDGAQVDDGTAWEIGFACAKKIPVVGIRTDSRHAGDTAFSVVNAMIEGSCLSIVSSADEAVLVLKKLVPPSRKKERA